MNRRVRELQMRLAECERARKDLQILLDEMQDEVRRASGLRTWKLAAMLERWIARGAPDALSGLPRRQRRTIELERARLDERARLLEALLAPLEDDTAGVATELALARFRQARLRHTDVPGG